MIVSYLTHPWIKSDERKQVRVHVTTAHPASHYGQPVMVLPDGGAIDLMSWILCGYQIERATKAERAKLHKVLAALGAAV
jgi:hypothetical protein